MDYSLNTLCQYRCQLCLQSEVKVEPLKQPKILDKIRVCFQLVMSIKNDATAVICNICIQELDIAYNLHRKCIAFNERISYLSEEKLENKYTEKDAVNEKVKLIQETNESDALSTFQCTICKKKLKTNISLIKHRNSMHTKRKYAGTVTGSGTNRRHHCTKCSYSTPHSQTLVNHMRRHNGERPYHCECGKSFTQASSLTAHYKTHSNATFFTCTVCGKQFKHAFTLKKHQQVHESGKFLCEICKKYLKSQQTLKEHIHRHYNVRNYSCEDCGSTFVSASELKNHRMTHSIVKKSGMSFV